MKYLYFSVTLILIAACSEPAVEFEHFLDKEPQAVTERSISSLGEPDAILNFSDHEIYSAGTLEQNETQLFSINYGTFSIARMDKEDFSNLQLLSFSEGSGPGELQALQSIAVSNERVYAGDPRQLRIVITDVNGSYIEDLNTSFSPNGLFSIGENRLLNNAAHQQDHLFVMYDVERDSTNGFEEITFGFDDVMKYPGYLSADQDYIFYAGYSEPLLRKYSTDGTLLFSRATIDNYDTSDQYVARTMGENRVVGFSDDAKYSSLDVAHHGDKFLVIPHHNGEAGFKYLDVYDASDGNYIETFLVDYNPRKIVLDDEYLYLLATDGEDNFLLRYQNSLIR